MQSPPPPLPQYVTLFVFSTENWRRPAAEVAGLMSLLEHNIAANRARMAAAGIRLTAIGQRNRLSPALQALLADADADAAAAAAAVVTEAATARAHGTADHRRRAVGSAEVGGGDCILCKWFEALCHGPQMYCVALCCPICLVLAVTPAQIICTTAAHDDPLHASDDGVLGCQLWRQERASKCCKGGGAGGAGRPS
jgi:Putative undecaprenyl diphosphate synthase